MAPQHATNPNRPHREPRGRRAGFALTPAPTFAYGAAMRRAAATAVTVATVGILASTAPAHAGGFGIPEIGARRTAMAAVIGRPDEPAAVFHNPAGLVLMPGVHVYASLGLSLINTSFRLRPWDGSDELIDAPIDAEGYYPAVKPTRAMGVIPMLAVTFELIPDRLFGAATLYVSNGTGAQFDEDAVTRYHLIDGYVISPLAAIAAAYKITPKIAVGAGFGIMNLRLKGKREIYPIINGGDLRPLIGSNALLELEGSGWSPTWNVGFFAAPHPRVTVGASVIGRVDASIEGPLKLTYGDDASEPGGVLEGRQKTKQLLPWTFMAGINVDVHPNVEVGTELRYWLYRQYDEQRTEIEDIFLIRELVTRKDYRDSWEVSGGVRVHDLAAAPGLDLMLGTHYDRTPAPTKSLTLDSPSFTHIGLHSGARYSFGRYRLGLTYVHYWYDIPDIADSITSPPSNVDGHGANNIVTASFEAAL
jgi:long-subunit fatty acid transport protein